MSLLLMCSESKWRDCERERGGCREKDAETGGERETIEGGVREEEMEEEGSFRFTRALKNRKRKKGKGVIGQRFEI